MYELFFELPEEVNSAVWPKGSKNVEAQWYRISGVYLTTPLGCLIKTLSQGIFVCSLMQLESLFPGSFPVCVKPPSPVSLWILIFWREIGHVIHQKGAGLVLFTPQLHVFGLKIISLYLHLIYTYWFDCIINTFFNHFFYLIYTSYQKKMLQ